MEDERIVLSALWIVLFFCYLLGDVLRIYAGDVTPGEFMGQPVTQILLLGLTLFMLIPIFMIVLSLVLPYSVNRRVNILTAIFLFVFNIAGLPYPSLFDSFLIIVGVGFNALTAGYAWKWASQLDDESG